MLSGLSWEQLRLWLVVTSFGTTLWWLNHLKDWEVDCSCPWPLTCHFIIRQNGDPGFIKPSNQPHGEDMGCFTMSVVSVAVEHTDEVSTSSVSVGSWSFIQLSLAEGSMILKLLNHKDFRWKTQQISLLWVMIIPSFHVDIVIIMINFLCYIAILKRENPVVSWDTWLLV
jgi:hypothetical protein